MQIKYLQLLILILGLLSQNVSAQNFNAFGSVGAKSAAMGGVSTAIADEWAILNNIGALAANKNLESPTAMISFENRFNNSSLNAYHFGILSPLKIGGVTGLSISRFGDKYYNETQVGLAYSHQISLVSVGAKVNYYQAAANDQIGITQQSRSTFLIELGGMAKLSEKWAVGIYGYNFTNSKLKSSEGEDRIPVILKAGVSYQPYQKLLLSLETQKDIDYEATVNVGLAYQIHKNFSVRTGISTQPYNIAFGVAFQPKTFSFDYALANNNALGWIHQISIRYTLLSKKSEPTIKEEK